MEAVEVRKVDEEGRVLLPSKWRARELAGADEVIVVSGPGYLKIMPKKKVDLTMLFDKVELGVDAIDDWGRFESSLFRDRP